MRLNISNPAIQHLTYGSAKPLFFEGRTRYHEYTNYKTQEVVHESVLCLDSNDLSPIKTGSATYEERQNCHCCFAGYAHSIDLCNKSQANKIN